MAGSCLSMKVMTCAAHREPCSFKRLLVAAIISPSSVHWLLLEFSLSVC